MSRVYRRAAQLTNLDLNLLVALRELIRERNVTRAAERIGVTQPAASAALARLRRHFGDDLLVRGKGGYALTPLATQLADQVEMVCAATERLFATGANFDPAESEREFSLLMADYTIAVIGERLSQLLDAAAPHVTLHVRLVRESLAADAASTIRLIDGIVAPPMGRLQAPDIKSAELFRDRWVCVVSAGNRLLGTGALSLSDLTRMPWVVPFYQTTGYPPANAPVPRQLTLLGLQPQLAVRVESYEAVPHFIVGTDRVALLQERLVSRLADRLDLRVLECPGEPEPIVETLWWHENHERDLAHTWLRNLIVEAARDL